MDFSPFALFVNIILSVVGFSYFVYGKKQQNLIFIFDGIALCISPYLISKTVINLIVGIVLIVFPLIYKD